MKWPDERIEVLIDLGITPRDFAQVAQDAARVFPPVLLAEYMRQMRAFAFAVCWCKWCRGFQ